MKIIREIWKKCKQEWFLALVLILTAGLAFGLGRISANQPIKPPVRVESNLPLEAVVTNRQDRPESNNTTTSVSSTGQVVGSKQGSKYHWPWCSGAKRIKPENLITFTSVEEARAAGYEPAANCPGL